MPAPETSKNQWPSKAGSLKKGQRRYWKPQVEIVKRLLEAEYCTPTGASERAPSTNLPRFDKTILSVIWLLPSMYLTALQGTLFLF